MADFAKHLFSKVCWDLSATEPAWEQQAPESRSYRKPRCHRDMTPMPVLAAEYVKESVASRGFIPGQVDAGRNMFLAVQQPRVAVEG